MNIAEYAIDKRDSGWVYVIESRTSDVFSSREEAEDAAIAAAKRRAERDEELDEALEDTFPASDPVSATRTTHPGKPQNR
jgi:hypothetical protein